MKSPRLSAEHHDRLLDCQEQMEDAFIHFADQARSAGWEPTETLVALRELAVNHLNGLGANVETERQIAEALAAMVTKH